MRGFFGAVSAAFASFFRAVGTAFAALLTAEGRKAWSLAVLCGGGMTMTGYAVAALWFVRHRAAYSFYLGLSAHLLVLVVITALAAMHVRRSMSIQLGKDRKIEFLDHDDNAAPTIEAAAAAVQSTDSGENT